MNFLKFINNPVSSQELLIIVNKSIIDNEDVITKIQKDQWTKGKDKEGNIIGKYKLSTEKASKKAPFPNTPKTAGRPYNLNWSGDFYKKTFIKTKTLSKDIKITIDSKSMVLKDLFNTIKKHGLISNANTIFGYQPKNLDKTTKIINKQSLINLKKRYGM